MNLNVKENIYCPQDIMKCCSHTEVQQNGRTQMARLLLENVKGWDIHSGYKNV